MQVREKLVIENARIMFRNFAGREEKYNTLGDRNFLLCLDPALADELRAEGWNVKQLKPREEGDIPQDYVQVAVNYRKGRPPRLIVISSRGRMELGADEAILVDMMDIKNIDVSVAPYEWEVNGNTGVKAYLRTAYITINEDELDLKYAGLPDANPTSPPSTIVNEDED